MWSGRPDCDGMGRESSLEVEVTPLIGICRALDLLATAAELARATSTYPPAPVRASVQVPSLGQACRGSPCLVRFALSLEQVGEDVLAALRDHRVRDLYALGRLSDRLTLGAMIVLDAAQQSEESGHTWGEALDDATGTAGRFLDLIPDRLFATAADGQVTPASSARRN